MTNPQTLRALAAELCEAKEGSRGFDVAIYERAVGPFRDSMTLQDIPHYTTSLDAKLPGEEIVSAYLSPTGWMAFDGRTKPATEACAHTEPLARRAAALLAMAATLEGEK